MCTQSGSMLPLFESNTSCTNHKAKSSASTAKPSPRPLPNPSAAANSSGNMIRAGHDTHGFKTDSSNPAGPRDSPIPTISESPTHQKETSRGIPISGSSSCPCQPIAIAKRTGSSYSRFSTPPAASTSSLLSGDTSEHDSEVESEANFRPSTSNSQTSTSPSSSIDIIVNHAPADSAVLYSDQALAQQPLRSLQNCVIHDTSDITDTTTNTATGPIANQGVGSSDSLMAGVNHNHQQVQTSLHLQFPGSLHGSTGGTKWTTPVPPSRASTPFTVTSKSQGTGKQK